MIGIGEDPPLVETHSCDLIQDEIINAHFAADLVFFGKDIFNTVLIFTIPTLTS